MKDSLLRLFVAALLLGLSAGCFMSRERVNEPLDPGLVRSLEPGGSTAADVVAVLGAPSEVVQLGRRSAWRYDFGLTKRAGLFLLVVALQNVDTRSDRVWVFFDEEGRLTHVGSTFEARNARYAMPWQKLDEKREPAPEPAEETAEETAGEDRGEAGEE